MSKGRSLLFGLLFPLVFAACSTVKYVPVETVKEVHVRDSVYLRDTVVRVELEKARISDFVDVTDTLVLSDGYSRSTAFLDTTRAVLRGSIETIKPYIEKPVQVKEKIVYRDSIITKDVPVPVEVEKHVKYVPFLVKLLAWIGALALIALFVKIGLKYVVKA